MGKYDDVNIEAMAQALDAGAAAYEQSVGFPPGEEAIQVMGAIVVQDQLNAQDRS